MDLTTDNAFRIYALPLPLLRPYLPKILDRVRVPAPGDGVFVETYVGQLENKISDDTENRQPGTGWSSLQQACVDCGIIETYISLQQHPHDDYYPALYESMNTLNDLSQAATEEQRLLFRDKAVAADCLNIFLDILKNGVIALYKHSAVRFLKILCSDLSYGELLWPAETARLMETLTRTALEETNSYSQELRDPDKSWQVVLMVTRIRTDPTTASRYGKRWFGLTQEILLWSAHSLFCRYPVPSRQYVLETIAARPQIIDVLLGLGNMPREDWYPETQAPAIAMEILATIFLFPIRFVPGINPPMSGPGKEARDAEWKATVSTTNLLVSRPNWIQKILGAWNRLDAETMQGIQRQLDRVQVDWYGEPPEPQYIKSIAELRGQIRISVLSLIEMATYSEDIKDADLLSFLRVTYLATQASISPAKDHVTSASYVELLEVTERLESVFRTPMSTGGTPEGLSYERDATHDIPPQSIGAPIALLRILTVLTKRGILDKAQSWTALPEGCAPGTSLEQVKQIMSRPVLKKLIPLVVKRMTNRREMSRLVVNINQWNARARYVEAARLGAAVLTLDNAANGRWKDNMHGLKKELVLCLGNAAEMSIRRQDFDAALGYALSADAVAHIADGGEGITEDTIAKNRRRVQTAQQGARDSLVGDIARLTIGDPRKLAFQINII